MKGLTVTTHLRNYEEYWSVIGVKGPSLKSLISNNGTSAQRISLVSSFIRSNE